MKNKEISKVQKKFKKGKRDLIKKVIED